MALSLSRNDKTLRRKFYHYLIPTVLMVLAMQFGSLADAIVIGNFLGEDFLSASSIALPIVFLTQIPAMLLGSGVAIVAANFLGKRMVKEASQAFKVSVFLGFVVSLVFIPLGIFASEPVAKLLAGNFQELVPMIAQYMAIYCYQAPIFGVGIVLAYFLPSDNSPNLGAAYFVICNVVHIATEIVFCLTLDKSVVMYGVGASTGIGMVAGFVVLIPYFKSKRRSIDLTVPLKGGFRYFKDVFKAGSSSGLLTLLTFVYVLVLNFAATAYLKPAELPVYAMLTNFSFVIDIFLLGVLQVMPSVISALYGEKDYFGVRSLARRVFILAIAITSVLTAISMAFPELFFYIFGTDLNAIRDATSSDPSLADPLFVIRIYCISFLLYAVNKYFSYYYPSIMINAPALAGNAFRVGLVGPIAIYFLMQAMGISGFAYGVIIMEAAALVIALIWVYVGRKTKRYSGKGVLLLPSTKKNPDMIDISIPAEEANISEAVEQLQKYALELSHDEKAAAMLALATEEIIANTIAYGYRRRTLVRYIDVNVSKTENGMLVRIRDDGVTFDPTAFVAGDEEEMRFHGIEVVRKVASDFKYLRVLNMNNTIMEISVAK